MLIISVINLWPWLFPETSILAYITALTAGLAILVSIRRDPHDRITARLLSLFIVATTPVATVIGNILVYSQWSAYQQQIIPALNLFSEGVPVQLKQTVFDLVLISPIYFIPSMNILVFVFIITLSPLIWSKITDAEPNHIPTDSVSQDRIVRISIALLIATYIIYILTIPFIIKFQFVKIGVDSANNLLWLYTPVIVFGTLHTVIKVNQYFEQRSLLSGTETEGFESVLPDSEVEAVLSDEIERPARGVDMFGRNPVVVLNEGLIQNLTTDEIRAIYTHELYHFQNGYIQYQLLSNLPLVGPLLFFILVSPEKAFHEEYQADKYAANEVGQQAVIRALNKANKLENITDPSQVIEGNSWDKKSFLLFLSSIPVVSLYRPTRKQRIQNLKRSGSGEPPYVG